jgi:hypothetical protein
MTLAYQQSFKLALNLNVIFIEKWKNMAKINTKVALIRKWMKLSKEAKEAKDLEAEARRDLASELSTEIGTKRGLEGMLKWKVENGLNYNIDKLGLNALIAKGELSAAELLCIKWKPELSLTEYKKLGKEDRATLDSILTITPAMPTIEIKVDE